MSIREDLFEFSKRRFEDGFECRLRGTRDQVEAAIISVSHGLRLADFRLSAEKGKYRSGEPIVTVRAERISGTSGGSIGVIRLLEMPGGAVLLRVPEFRGSDSPRAWAPDDDGAIFAEYLTRLLAEFESLGFAGSFDQTSLLSAAKEQLALAADPKSFASIGNTCRSALIELANSMYEPRMSPEDQAEPKGDDAVSKLDAFIKFHMSTVSTRYRDGLLQVMRGTWSMTSSLTHRKNPQLEDAQTCVQLTESVIIAIGRLHK